MRATRWLKREASASSASAHDRVRWIESRELAEAAAAPYEPGPYGC